jgi:hypothetical protein
MHRENSAMKTRSALGGTSLGKLELFEIAMIDYCSTSAVDIQRQLAALMNSIISKAFSLATNPELGFPSKLLIDG